VNLTFLWYIPNTVEPGHRRRPGTFTVATAIAARTTTFRPLVAIRPGYWQPAHFASAAATLDRLSGGRLLVNIVSGQDNPAAYGDVEGDQAQRYARTKEFMRLVGRPWTEERVTYAGEHFRVTDSTVTPCLYTAPGRYGGGGAGTTWLVGSPDDVTAALRRYAELGVRHFVLSDIPYKRETARVGDALIGRVRESEVHSGQRDAVAHVTSAGSFA
jgi:alkanesulfonate monooxygenase